MFIESRRAREYIMQRRRHWLRRTAFDKRSRDLSRRRVRASQVARRKYATDVEEEKLSGKMLRICRRERNVSISSEVVSEMSKECMLLQ